MFVVTLTYRAGLDEIDAALGDHVSWLEEQYTDGVFLPSGPQVPRVGGVILARGNRDDLERRLASDPFRQRGLTHRAVTEFSPSRLAEGLEHLNS